jgi:hypothetical protein
VPDPILGDDERVFSALSAAGWMPGRRCQAVEGWTEALTTAGFVVHGLARHVWAELGALKILSSPERVPSSSLFVDPVDAGIDSLEENQTLNHHYNDSFAPLGMWSQQFRSYVGSGGRVVAVTVQTIWELGATFPEALDYIINGDEGGSRARTVAWL